MPKASKDESDAGSAIVELTSIASTNPSSKQCWHWQEAELYLSLDTSLFWDEYCLIRLAVVHRARALPLAWRVLKHPSVQLPFGTID